MPFRIVLAGLPLLLAAAPAFAHHPMGGMRRRRPSCRGFFPAVGHPVIGIDHFAFVVALGLAAAFMRNVWAPPLAAVAGMTAGCLLAVGSVALPIVEPVVALSVLLLGGMVLFGRSLSGPVAAALFAAAGHLPRRGLWRGRHRRRADARHRLSHRPCGGADGHCAGRRRHRAERVEGGFGRSRATPPRRGGLRRHRPGFHRGTARGRAARLSARHPAGFTFVSAPFPRAARRASWPSRTPPSRRRG